MQTVAIHAFHPSSVELLRLSLGASFTLLIRRRIERVFDVLRYSMINSVIIELVRPDGKSAIPVMNRILREYPATPVFGFLDPVLMPHGLQEVPRALQVGVTEIIVRGLKDPCDIVRRNTPPSAGQQLCEVLRKDIEAIPLPEVRDFCTYALRHADKALTLPHIAEKLHTTPDRLTAAFRAIGMRSPSWFISRARPLLAATLLQQPQRYVGSVAVMLGYTNGDALSHALKRATGVRASLVGDPVVAAKIIDDFSSELRRGWRFPTETSRS